MQIFIEDLITFLLIFLLSVFLTCDFNPNRSLDRMKMNQLFVVADGRNLSRAEAAPTLRRGNRIRFALDTVSYLSRKCLGND